MVNDKLDLVNQIGELVYSFMYQMHIILLIVLISVIIIALYIMS